MIPVMLRSLLLKLSRTVIDMEWLAFAASAVTALLSFLGVYMSNRKQTALMDYRLQQLEKKIGQHNNLEGRVIALETKVQDMHNAS